jgi:hypothetical protein
MSTSASIAATHLAVPTLGAQRNGARRTARKARESGSIMAGVGIAY